MGLQLYLDSDCSLNDIKINSQQLADHFIVMGLFKKLNYNIQNIQSVTH